MYISIMGIREMVLAAGLLLATSGSAYTAHFMIERGGDFQATIDLALTGDTITIAAGKTVSATPRAYADPLCGNCLNPKDGAQATVGFLISGKSLVIRGVDRASSMIQTNAGYGIFIENAPFVLIQNLTVTGGVRDLDGNATDAGIVVRNSRVLVEQVTIRDNQHRPEQVVVGIGGIIGREGAELSIRNCELMRNGWDGVALYRGAHAEIIDCVIADGRGAGIGVTWDASCTAFRNEVRGYWKGIGAFGTAWVIARNNIVRDNLGWGCIATGQSYMDMTNNLIYHNGNCGVAPWSTETRGKIVNNVIALNGWREEWVCPCVGVWNGADWAKWEFAHNVLFENKEGNYYGVRDQAGLNGNLTIDPLLNDTLLFFPLPNSPLWNAGDSSLYNRDGTRSHIGPHGGAQARQTTRK